MTDFDDAIRRAHILDDEDRALRQARAVAVAAALIGMVPLIVVVLWAMT